MLSCHGAGLLGAAHALSGGKLCAGSNESCADPLCARSGGHAYWVGGAAPWDACMYVCTVPPCRDIEPGMSLCCPLLPLPLPLPCLPSEVVGTQTWLACREALAESLAHLHSHAPHLSSPLSLASVCAEGQREASACGMSGTVALLQWCRAVHCLGRKKADLDSAVSSLEVSQSAGWSLGRLHSV